MSMDSRVTWLVGVLAAALASAGGAAAHTSYLLPSVFTPVAEELVTIQASFAERQFFRPEVAVTSEDFHLLRPDGRRDTFDRIAIFNQVTVLESDVKEAGTYRFTTGERLGRAGRQVLDKGAWRPVELGETPPADARTKTSQTVTVAEVYVTKGAPTRPAVDAPSGRLAIRTDAHPNDIYLDRPLALSVTFDGAPLAGQAIEIDREGGALEEPKYVKVHRDERLRQVSEIDRGGRQRTGFMQARTETRCV